jgi:ribosomal protein L7Ae-like RNA K-turn-binding protein
MPEKLTIDYCKKNKIKLIEIKYNIKKEDFKSYIKNVCNEYSIKYCKFDF